MLLDERFKVVGMVVELPPFTTTGALNSEESVLKLGFAVTPERRNAAVPSSSCTVAPRSGLLESRVEPADAAPA